MTTEAQTEGLDQVNSRIDMSHLSHHWHLGHPEQCQLWLDNRMDSGNEGHFLIRTAHGRLE